MPSAPNAAILDVGPTLKRLLVEAAEALKPMSQAQFLLRLWLRRGSICVALCLLAVTVPIDRVVYSIGITLQKSGKHCALVVRSVYSHSPAASAGIRAGDEISGIDGKDTRPLTLFQAAALIRSAQPGMVTLTLQHRNGETHDCRIQRVAQEEILALNHLKDVSGAVVPIDTTVAEVRNMLNFDGRRIVERVFPLHYPSNTSLFYAGFELFILREPREVMVGGIETSPASRAGVHWGDVLVAVNGIRLEGKNSQEVEALFLSKGPTTMQLTLDRLGSRMSLRFQLEQASEVLKENQLRLANGKLVPDNISDRALRCGAT
jgi:membrane-associated protease RseP (regulator of RpoE activity)